MISFESEKNSNKTNKTCTGEINDFDKKVLLVILLKIIKN